MEKIKEGIKNNDFNLLKLLSKKLLKKFYMHNILNLKDDDLKKITHISFEGETN